MSRVRLARARLTDRDPQVEGPVRRFGGKLAAIAACGLAVRVGYVLIARRHFQPGGDALFYHGGANLLAAGEGFVSPFFFPAARVPAADHPPLYLLFLAIASSAGFTSVLAHLLWSCVPGTATVVGVGLLGRIVAGDAVGLTAAAIAAVYPNMWAPDGMLQAETVATLATTLAVLLAYRAWPRPTPARAASLGAVCGAAALARSELVLLVPLLVAPVALRARAGVLRQCLAAAGAGVVAASLVIAPWAVYNSTRFAHPILLSSQFGVTLASANCDSTYYGNFPGYFDIGCALAVRARAGLTALSDQSILSIVYRRAAVDYVRAHRDALPAVAGIRLLRVIGLFHPTVYAGMDTFVEGREWWLSWSALFTFYVLALLSVVGVVGVGRRDGHVSRFPLLAPVAIVVVTVVATYGSTRFRATAEPMFAVLGAVGLDAIVRHARRSGIAASPEHPAHDT